MTQTTQERPATLATYQAEMARWAVTCTRTLEYMINDIRDGKLIDDTLVKDFDHIRHLMDRRDELARQIRLHTGPHRGPETVGHREI